jgi:hypothetical protein
MMSGPGVRATLGSLMDPFADLPGAWHHIPESTALVVGCGADHMLRPFQPA